MAEKVQKRKYTDHVCQYCGKLFSARSDSPTKYCSKGCRSAATRKPPKMYMYVCVGCGGRFESKRSDKKFCSPKCYGTFLMKPDIQCPTCGKMFYKKRTKIKFCSVECSRKYHDMKILVKCDNCGKELRIAPSIAKKNTHHFCSQECYWKQQSNLTKGKLTNGGVYHHGEYIFLYQESKRYKQQHRIVMEEYLGRKLNSNEIVHHIDGNKGNNDISNLQIVTRAEHINIHRDELHKARGVGNYKKSEVDK